MKYNDDGTIKEIKVKSFDTLPVGSEVDYDGSVVPDGWTEVEEVGEITTSYGTLYYTKIGKLVHIEGDLTGLQGTYKTITTLPSEIKPKYSKFFWNYINENTQGSIAISNNSGIMQAVHNNMDGGSYTSSETLRVNVTYFTD